MGTEKQVGFLVLIGVLMVGLLSFTIYRELRWAQEIEKRTITTVKKKKEPAEKQDGTVEKEGQKTEGETGKEEPEEVEREEYVETTKISRSIQVHYDVLGAFIGAGIVAASLLAYWISGFLGLVKMLDGGKGVKYEDIALSGILLLSGLLVVFAGFILSSIAVLTL